MVWCGVVWCGVVWCGVVCGKLKKELLHEYFSNSSNGKIKKIFFTYLKKKRKKKEFKKF